MSRYTKPDVLLSDVVKKKPISETVKKFANTTTVKAKTNQSKSTGQGGNDSIVRPCVDENKCKLVSLFIYLGFYVIFNTVQVIS